MNDSVDYCAIGGGIMGVAMAREMARRSPGATVVVLEKSPGSDSTPADATRGSSTPASTRACLTTVLGLVGHSDGHWGVSSISDTVCGC